MPKGSKRLNTGSSTYNALDFVIEQNLKNINTCELVQVTAVNSDDTLDVIPMVYSVDGDNKVVDRSVIYSRPYLRLQAGANGIIIKPNVGDIGLMCYCQRDITNVLSSGYANTPDTKRFLSENDGVYICSVANLMSAPTRVIEFSDSGISITASTTLTINGDVKINGKLQATGTIDADGKITSKDDCISGTISGKTHTHTVPQSPSGTQESMSPTA